MLAVHRCCLRDFGLHYGVAQVHTRMCSCFAPTSRAMSVTSCHTLTIQTTSHSSLRAPRYSPVTYLLSLSCFCVLLLCVYRACLATLPPLYLRHSTQHDSRPSLNTDSSQRTHTHIPNAARSFFPAITLRRISPAYGVSVPNKQ